MAQQELVELVGSPGSPYTRKMLALLRFRRIPYTITWASHENRPEHLPAPKVNLLPTFYLRTPEGAVEAAVDSTPITRRLENRYQGRAVVPADAELLFYNDLIEDYADEWLTKAMFHYRWFHETDRDHAGPLLCYWTENKMSPDMADEKSAYYKDKQFNRLYVVGSNETTARTIEDSYVRLLDVLDKLLLVRGYVLGERPSVADFAIYGQLTQLGIVEPTPSSILSQRTPRVRAWLDRMEDLSGLEPDSGDWFTQQEARAALRPLLTEIGRVYAPFLLANADAVRAGRDTVSAQIDGRTWTQPTFPIRSNVWSLCAQVTLRCPRVFDPRSMKP